MADGTNLAASHATQYFTALARERGFNVSDIHYCNLDNQNNNRILNCNAMGNWDYIQEKEYTLFVYNPNLEDENHFSIQVKNQLLKIKAEVALETKYEFKQIKVESLCPGENIKK